MNYQETVGYLYTLRNRGTKLGLDPMRAVLAALGNPQERFRSVHVAGTNGKGTVSAMLAAIFAAARIRYGLYTSPHLVSFTERIVVDGKRIEEIDVVRLAGKILEISGNKGLNPTFFEVATGAAFAYFAAEAVEWAVAEVGLGGRLDATNVLCPAACVITNVAVDHQAYLGESIEEIATEKAGILKPGIPACTGATGLALDVLKRRAEAVGAPLDVLGEHFHGETLDTGPSSLTVRYQEPGWTSGPITIPLIGKHNAANAALAIRAARYIAGSVPRIGDGAITAGLSAVRWPGRIEQLPWDGPGTLLVDSAHNPAAAQVLADTLKGWYGGRPILCILGMLDDKDPDRVAAPLAPLVNTFIATQPEGDRALSTEALAAVLRRTGRHVEVAPNLAAALACARTLATDASVVLVTGSFYTIGAVKELLGEKGCLSSLRE